MPECSGSNKWLPMHPTSRMAVCPDCRQTVRMIPGNPWLLEVHPIMEAAQ